MGAARLLDPGVQRRHAVDGADGLPHAAGHHTLLHCATATAAQHSWFHDWTKHSFHSWLQTHWFVAAVPELLNVLQAQQVLPVPLDAADLLQLQAQLLLPGLHLLQMLHTSQHKPTVGTAD